MFFRSRRAVWALAIVVVLSGLALGLRACHADDVAADRPNFARAQISIRDVLGQEQVFQVELARSLEEQTYGLMFLRQLAPDGGMLFIYDAPSILSFWMKNTFIPLDLLFIGPDWRIDKIVPHAQPLSETPIMADVPALAVLELAGGTAAARGINPGDLVVFGGY